ncbi:hypothetical protein FOZ60_004737 [Perkinsus olseni]|uniref:Uncharacterized protein n=1 Tax=Perkinsus olseni TaxID=32597 RepID=A0A7J6NSN0_PEROL|nr:hypothetical protein FOZ60_004737 [Perkinsus olseni]
MADSRADCQGKAASWTNEFGDDYAEHSAVFAKDADAEHMEMMGLPVRDVIMPAIEEALRDLGGKALKEAKRSILRLSLRSMRKVDSRLARCVKILEIGCGTGKSNSSRVTTTSFPGNPALDIVLCKQCLNHVPPADYDEFFDKIRRLQPKYFIFSEGINPNGYEANLWGPWTFHTNDFLKLCSHRFGEPIYVKNFVAKEPEMFAPLTHDTTAVFRL